MVMSHEARVYLEENFGIKPNEAIPPAILKTIEETAKDNCLPMDEKRLDVEIFQANAERMKVAV